MAGHSRSKNGVASLADVPAISLRLAPCVPKRDARDKRGHDEQCFYNIAIHFDATKIASPTRPPTSVPLMRMYCRSLPT